MNGYKGTTWACYVSYMVQAVVNNLPPLLFLTFQREYGLSLSSLGLLIVLNFGSQLAVDLLSAHWAEKWGYRRTMVFGHLCAALGLLLLGILPAFLGFSGILVAMVLNAVGGGIVEVLVSPIVEAIPDESAKSSALATLHSFYCWGTVAVIIVTTLLFSWVGTLGWSIIPLVWIPVPLLALAMFLRVPIAPLIKEGGKGMGLGELFSSPVFWVLALMMVFSSCSELSMSQWASFFAETGLGVSKQMGNLLGPCAFAFLMGVFRFVYGRRKHLPVERIIIVSALVCFLGYLIAVFATNPVVSLLGCALCGPAVALFWPGTFAIAPERLPLGGTRMFALLAFFGDVGCAIGPEAVSLMGDIRHGLLLASVFPLLMGFCAFALPHVKDRRKS